MASTPINKVLDDLRANKRVKPIELVRPNPEMATILSKLVPSEEPSRYNRKGNREITDPQIRSFQNVSQHTAQSVQDADTVMNILTDMDLCKQILVSATLSPKDMGDDINLRITGPEGFFSPALLGSLLNEVQKHFEQDYKIREVLPRILEDMFFNTGSYAVATLPENSVDDAINSHRAMSMESFTEFFHTDGRLKSMGVLGSGPQTGLPPTVGAGHSLSLEGYRQVAADQIDNRILFLDEAFTKTASQAAALVTVTDNMAALKVPYIQQRLREEAITKIYPLTRDPGTLHPAFESYEQQAITDRELDQALFQRRQTGYKPIMAFKTQEQLSRYAVGEPLILHLPSESVIPVFIPGTPEKQVGFFVLVDSNGNPVTRTANTDYYQQLSSRLNSNGNFPSAMLQKVQSQMGGFPSITDHQTDYSVRYYQEVVEADLLARLRTGLYGNGVALANRPEIFRIMLARSLASQFTQLVFIPVEYMTYFAFQYSPDGIGQSYLDDLRVLNSMRAMALFTQVMAGVRNSIPRTSATLTLDPEDPDPWKTIEILTHEIVRSRQQYFPLGMNSPTDLVDWMQKASIQIGFKNHPAVPEVGVEFTETNTTFVKPDTELMEYLNRQAILKTGLTPDTVDAAMHAEFATSIVRNSVMLSKRISKNQRLVEPFIGDHGRKHILTHGALMDRLKQMILNNFDEVDIDVALGKQTLPGAQDNLNEKIRDKDDARFKNALKPMEDDSKDTDATAPATDEDEAGKESTAEPASKASIPYSVIKNVRESDQQLDGPIRLNTEKEAALTDYKKSYIADALLKRFVLGLEWWLPRPDTTTEENLLLEVESHSKLVDEVIESWFSEKMFTDGTVGSAIAQNGEAIKLNIKACFMRDWFMKNGVMTEMADIATLDENGKPKLALWEKIRSHFDAVIKPMTSTMVEIYKTQQYANKALGIANPDNNGDGGGASDSFGGGGGSSTSDEMPDLANLPESGTTDTGSTDENTSETPETPSNPDENAETPPDEDQT